MAQCCVPTCQNSESKGYRCFSIPSKNKFNRDQWLANSGLREEDYANMKTRARFCEAHFKMDCFERTNLQGWLGLMRNAVPTIFGENLPRTVSLVCGQRKRDFAGQDGPGRESNENLPQIQPELPPPEPRLPLPQHTPGNNSTPAFKRRSISICHENLSEAEKLQLDLEEMTRQMERYRKLVVAWKAKADNLAKNLSKFLNKDQIDILQLEDPTSNTREWSEATIKQALQIRLMVGAQGYEFLRKQQKWPLPSYRTLRRRLDCLHFAPGNHSEITKLLPSKVVNPEDPASRLCVLSFDAMKIGEGVSYDMALKKCLGLVTPCVAKDEKEEETLATHVLVVVLKGLVGHWKQITGYVFVTQKTTPEKLWQYLSSVIVSVHDVGLRVCMMSADQAGDNTAIGNLVGVFSKKNGVRVCFPHPVPGEEDIIWMADVPHVFKNYWLQLLRSDMTLPEDVQQKFDLPSRVVSANHVSELLKVQSNNGTKLVPKLTEHHVNPSQFEKMRVGMAATFFSEVHGNALIFLSEKGLISKEAATTGWFLNRMARWYKLMCNRHIFDALGEDEYVEERLGFLGEFHDLTNRSTFPGSRKPVQNAVALSTTAVLELHNKYVKDGPVSYILTARCTSSGCENVFSQARGSGVENPTASRVRAVLRLISVGQFLHVTKFSSYDTDDDDYAVDFLQSAAKQKALTTEDDLERALQQCTNEAFSVDLEDVDLSFVQECGLYYMSGWAVSKVSVDCEVCRTAVRSLRPLEIAEAAWTEKLSRGGLAHPTAIVYHAHHVIEKIFVKLGKQVLKMDNPVDTIVTFLHQELPVDFLESFPDCHDVLGLAVTKFTKLRMHVATKDFSTKEVVVSYSSKSAYKSTSSANVGRRPLLERNV